LLVLFGRAKLGKATEALYPHEHDM